MGFVAPHSAGGGQRWAANAKPPSAFCRYFRFSMQARQASWGGPGGSPGYVEAVVQLRELRALKGAPESPGDTMSIAAPGGTVGDLTPVVAAMERGHLFASCANLALLRLKPRFLSADKNVRAYVSG